MTFVVKRRSDSGSVRTSMQHRQKDIRKTNHCVASNADCACTCDEHAKQQPGPSGLASSHATHCPPKAQEEQRIHLCKMPTAGSSGGVLLTPPQVGWKNSDLMSKPHSNRNAVIHQVRRERPMAPQRPGGGASVSGPPSPSKLAASSAKRPSKRIFIGMSETTASDCRSRP